MRGQDNRAVYDLFLAADNAKPFVAASERQVSALFLLQFLSDLLDFSPDSEQIAAPEFSDLLFGVAAADQFEGDVEGFGGAVPAVDSAAAIKVRRNSNVIDADELHGVIDVIHEVLDVGTGGGRQFGVKLGEALVVF